MNILFRADSSSTIGLGHIMRDLVLAKRFEKDNVIFACQNLQGHITHKIPYKTHILASNSHEELIGLIKSLQIDMVVFDHYGINDAFEKKVKEDTNVKILSFDDMYKKHHCDILLNHNISANPKRYKELVPPSCELWCGSKYTLIRDEFIKEKRKKRKKIYDVLIAMGGTDSANLNISILKMLPNNLCISVLTTSANANLEALQNYTNNKPNIFLHINSQEVAKLINQSYFAIITPSVVVHEILYMRVPFLAIKTAVNQDDIYMYLKKNGYATMESFYENSNFIIP